MTDQYKHHEMNKSDESSAPNAVDRVVGKKEEAGNKFESEGIDVDVELDDGAMTSREDLEIDLILGEELQQSNSSSKSSLVAEDGEMKKKKTDKKKCDDNKPTQETEEKTEEVASPPPTPAAAAECAATPGADDKEKKG